MDGLCSINFTCSHDSSLPKWEVKGLRAGMGVRLNIWSTGAKGPSPRVTLEADIMKVAEKRMGEWIGSVEDISWSYKKLNDYTFILYGCTTNLVWKKAVSLLAIICSIKQVIELTYRSSGALSIIIYIFMSWMTNTAKFFTIRLFFSICMNR